MTEKQTNMRKLGLEAAYLITCALRGTVPVCDGIDLNALYPFCKFHSVTSIVAMALEEMWKTDPAPEAEMKRWRQARDKAIRKNILLNAEREQILGFLESIGCWYLPLKGSLLQFDYPKFGMRQMNDNDILFDEAFQSRIHDFMISRGYEAAVYQKGNHDEYIRQPVYNFEMHTSLFMKQVSPELDAYYQDIRSRMIKDPSNQYGYHLSNEDFYIYLVAHDFKHYQYSGIGIRSLMDSYVYLQKHGTELNWEYIFGELEKFGASAFEKQCRVLSQKLFESVNADPELSPEDSIVLDEYFTSGTFGTYENTVRKGVASGENSPTWFTTARYLLRRLFPPVWYMIHMEPWLEQKKWLIPWAYVRRLFRGLFLRFRDISRELSLALRAKSDK